MAFQNAVTNFTANLGSLECTQKNARGMDFMSMEDHLDMVGMSEVSLKGAESGQGGSNAPWSGIKQGQETEMKVGDSGRKMFVGKIVGMRHGHAKGRNSCTVRSMCPQAEMQGSRETKFWEDKSDGDIIKEVLGKYPMGSVEGGEGEEPYTMQRNESDFRFVRRLAAKHGLIVTTNEGKIDVKKPPSGGGGLDIPKENLINLDVSQSSKNIPKGVRVCGWDYKTKKKVEGFCGPDEIEGIGGGGSMASEGQNWGGEAFISDVHCDTQEKAKKIATAEMNRLARQGVQGRVTVQGNGEMFAGGIFKMSGQQGGFNAEALIVSARHRIHNKTGFVTECTFCSNTKPA